jgi:hypothetical protein
MTGKSILLICGTLNQTRAMLAVGQHLGEHHCYYTPFYCDGHLLRASRRGHLDFTVLSGPLRERSLALMREHEVPIDERGEGRDYDLVVTCTDLILQRNLAGRRIVLVQEGLTEPEGVLYWLARHAGWPRVFANTAAFGLSNGYEVFCVASQGAKEMFRAKGVRDDKMVVTGISNFDHVDVYRSNDFPHRDFVLVCTSNARETFKYDDRMQFLRHALRIAGGREVIFKLHPAEQQERAMGEIRSLAPDARILRDGDTEAMIANSAAVIAQYSTVAFTAALLGKEVHSYIDPEHLRQVLPVQNGGTSAQNIATVCRAALEAGPDWIDRVRTRVEPQTEPNVAPGTLHLVPHGGLGALGYPLVGVVRHFVSRAWPSGPAAAGGGSSKTEDIPA